MKTNKEGRPLLLVGGQDGNGKMFTVLRAFLPNQRAWVFRWLFKTVFPLLLGLRNLEYVNLFLTDGDAHETSQLDAAIDEFFPQARQARCGWHITDRGWDRNGPKLGQCHPGIKSNQYTQVKHTVLQWITSWMKVLPEQC